MNKIGVLAVVGTILPWCLQAAEFEMSSVMGKESSQTKYNSENLYNFSKELLNAVQNCQPYKENFAAVNPNLKVLGDMFGGTELAVNVEIFGQENGMCHFTISSDFSGLPISYYDCKIDNGQRAELLKAMQNRSTKEITETFPYSYNVTIEYDNQITQQKVEAEKTVTGNIFDVTYEKVLAHSCEMKEAEPTAEQQDNAQKEMMKFSDDFRKALQNCRPATEKKSLLGFEMANVEIIGFDSNHNCQMQVDKNFSLKVPQDKLAELSNWDDLLLLEQDESITTYKPVYYYDGLVSVLQACKNGEANYSGGMQTSKYGNTEIKNGISSVLENKVCRIKFENTLSFGKGLKDYGQTCTVPLGEVSTLLTRHSEMSGAYQDVSEAGKMIYETIIRSGYCQSK